MISRSIRFDLQSERGRMESEEENRREGRRERGRLVDLCIESATSSIDAVEKWRRQRRTLERLPSQLADALFRRLQTRRLLYPSLLEVFQYSVERVDLQGESSVDAEWMAYLGAFRYLRTLNIAGCRSMKDSSLWPVTGLNTLKELDLSRCSKITDVGIKHVLSIPSLEKLCISETGITADGVMFLASLKNMRVLDLGRIPVTDSALSSLQVLTQLEHLDLWGTKISNRGAAMLEIFPRLNFLNLALTNVTELPALHSIKCLNMSNCTIHRIFYGDSRVNAPLSKLLLTGATFADVNEAFSNVEASYMTFLDMSASSISSFDFLVNMKGLEHLNLSSISMTDGLIEHVICVGGNLRYLNLSDTKISSNGICDLAEHVLNLETLCLSHTAIDDASLTYIGMMPALKAVDLSYTKIKGFLSLGRRSSNKRSSLRELQNLSRLESLNLEETLVRDEAVYPLAFFRNLKCLYLKSDFLSDMCLHALSSPLPNLRILGLRGAVLTNSGLLSYNAPPMLHVLDLRGCWLLTTDVISSFCSYYPQIEVRHGSIPTLSTDQNVTIGSSSFFRTTQASRLTRKGRRVSQDSKVTFVDERIKYSRVELLELQLSPLSCLAIGDLDVFPLMAGKE